MTELRDAASSASDNRQSLWKVEDVARYLKMAPQSIYRIVSENRIPFIKIGGALRFDEEEIRQWLKQKAALKKKRRII